MKTVIVKTKNNFKNLNGKPLKLVSIKGRRVSVEVFDEDIQRPVAVTFKRKEIVEFN